LVSKTTGGRQEQNFKVNGRFDLSDAVKLGKLANINILVTGRIEAFHANTGNETSNGFFANKTKVKGELVPKVTSRLISVETASILAAPAANVEERELLAQRTDVMPGMLQVQGPLSSKTTGATDVNAALLALVNRVEGWTEDDLAVLVESLLRPAELVNPSFSHRPVLPDEGDEFVLEAAIHGQAEIVTFNVRHFGPASRFGVRVFQPGEILRELYQGGFSHGEE
jgi:hypothetical protein